VFNNVAAGSALLWRTGARVPPWVDGRLLDAARFDAYRNALGSPEAFDRLAAQQGFRLVVLALQPFAPVSLVRHLLADPRWSLVQLDDTGVVFARREMAEARGIAALQLDSELPQAAAPVGTAAAWLHPCDPGAAFRRGRLLLAFGYPAAARADLTRAHLHCPGRWDVGRDLGRAHAALGNARAARPLLENAIRHAPDEPESWAALGQALAQSGDREGALRCLRRALELRPQDAGVRRALEALGG
jgi:tetratricopeptide (TPR) repeat protein